MRLRKQLITNLYLKSKDITKLANGYVVFKRANNHAHAIIPKSKIERTEIENKKRELQQKIDKLNMKLSRISGSDVIKVDAITKGSRRKYTKKNVEYWLKKREEMKANSPLYKYNATKNL